MKLALKSAFIAALTASSMFVVAARASAEIVCNAENECWHVHHPYGYHPGWGLVVHPNGWRWGVGDHYVWHEHRGRGYWHNGIWITF